MAHPCSQSVIKWREAGMIEPFDTKKMPNWGDISFGDAEGFTVNGQVFVVPVDWGSTGLTYRTDKVSKAEASTLQSFADPKFKGRISLPDNVDESWIHLKNALLEAAESTCGWTKGGRVRHSETWWWNDEVENTIKAKRTAWKLWKNGGSKDDYIQAKR